MSTRSNASTATSLSPKNPEEYEMWHPIDIEWSERDERIAARIFVALVGFVVCLVLAIAA